MTRRACLTGLVWVCLCGPAGAQAPAGGEFLVNSQTTYAQYAPAVAVDPNGDFVVAWETYGLDGSGQGVAVRRFSASGTPKGPEFVANGYTPLRQSRPAVATHADGSFVVVWDTFGQDGSSYGIRRRRFDAQGAPLEGGFAVNTYTTGYQWYPAIAANPDGRFAVAWVSEGEDGSGDGIFARMHDETGAALGAGFRVNTYTTGDQAEPAVGMDAVGNVRFVYQSSGEDGWDTGIVYRRFNYNGTPAGNFVVNTSTIGYQRYPSIAVNGSGAFVIAWMSAYYDGSGSAIFARVFDTLGAPLGPDFRVNTYTTGGQSRPGVAMDEAGNFVVTWLSYLQDGSHLGVFGQRFDALGAPLGGEFRVNTYTTSQQTAPAVGGGVDGDFVVVWAGAGGSDDYGVSGQRYGDLIFQDGFQAGDLARWSASQDDGGDLAASAAAGLGGTTFGLRAFMDDTQAMYVQDDSPAAEKLYRARFYLDPNNLDPGEGSGHLRLRVFIAFNASSQRLFAVVLRRQLGVYSVMARIRRDDGTRQDTGFFTISNAPHVLEFAWRGASGPGTLDAAFTMWIDDAIVSQLFAMDNDAAGGVEFARLGTMVVKAGASGTALFDQFESRRERKIGPEWP